MLNEFLFTKIEEEDIGNIWFQQDSATCHTTDAPHSMFCAVFLKIATVVVWLPRSCDLPQLDYYLWGAVKDKCYAGKPDRTDALKDNIR